MNSQNSKTSSIRMVLKELVLPYWTRSEDRWRARGLSALTLVLILAMVYALVLLNRWNQEFYDALQNLNKDEFIHQLWRFFFIALFYSVIMAYKFYVLQSLAIGWRQWITDKGLHRWLSEKNYYYWQLNKTPHDNPDQRLSDDIHEITDLSLEISEKVLRELITFVSFIGILWGLSSSLKFTALGYDIEFHHYLVWICLMYAAIGTWVIHKIGHPLSKLNFMQQKLEADFRYFLVRLRENSESIALLSGEKVEQQKLSTKFFQVVGNFKELISRQKKLILTTNIYGQLAYIFPFVVASPKVFTKEITLGRLFQISSAFGQVQGSVSVFVDMYAKIARLHSVVLRLGGFLSMLEENKELRHTNLSHRLHATEGTSLETEALRVLTPDQQTLLAGVNLRLTPGKRLLITAPSGKGKTTLLRTLNGIWPFIDGQIRLPRHSHRLVLTQKAYLPIGTLRAALAYPLTSEFFTDQDMVAALASTKLHALIKHLDEEDNWSQRLSSGEQQRLALARAFLQKPEVLFLDEATSALEKDTEAEIYQALVKAFPQMILVSFSHESSTLAAFHQETLAL
jgi:vitamin B12/bleomycin/antimicrobial peptide transport system ATP-binding/permease protein